jgi:hypothetical protein
MNKPPSNTRTDRRAAPTCFRRLSCCRGSSRLILTLTILACCAVFSASAKASCRSSASSRPEVTLPETRLLQTESLLQLSPQSTPEDEDDKAAIVGLWHVRFFSGGQLFDEGFDQWQSDGTEILNDTAPPQPANGAGTICLGVFKKTAPRTYKLRHPFWSFDANGNLAGSGVFLEQITVDKSGNNYSGSFSFFTYDLNGNVTSEVKGEIKAERITVE